MASELERYISKAREKHLSNEQIKSKLIATGWPEETVTAALTGAEDLPVPPPPPVIHHVGMWTGFLYILFFISLYVLATAIGGIFNAGVDKAIPPIVSNSGDYSSVASDVGFFFFDSPPIIRGYIAAIIVSYPLFMILSFALKKQLYTQPEVKNLRSRKILIYITLIGTFLILLSNIISTSYNFLSGTVTINALGHLFVTLLVAGTLFIYFISEVKNDRKTD